MKEIIGNLKEYFNNTEPESESDFAKCVAENNDYETWNVSESVFSRLMKYTEKDWKEHYPKAWWAYTMPRHI